MSRMNTETRVVFDVIRRAIEAQAETPSAADIQAELLRWRIYRNQRAVAALWQTLVKSGHLVEISGVRSSTRRWKLPGGDKCTVPRADRARRESYARAEAREAAEPKPANAYDANMRLGPPRRISGPSDAMRPVRGVRSPYGNFSLTGNAGEMCAA